MKTLLLLVIAAVLVSGCTAQNYNYGNVATTAAPTTTTSIISGQQTTTTQLKAVNEPKLIAGSTTRYLRFSRAHYENSLVEGKVIHLYFYANWCPICAEERPKIFDAYNKLNYLDVVGYEVHYNDNEVTDDDLYVTKLFQVPYQHTTIILNKKGSISFKSFAAIGTEKLVVEIEKAKDA